MSSAPREPKPRPAPVLDPEMGPIFEVAPRVVFGLREKTFKATTRWVFEVNSEK